MNPKEYLKLRGITIVEAAKQLGYTRPYLTEILNGKSPAGRKLAEAFEKWSDNAVSKEELMWPKKTFNRSFRSDPRLPSKPEDGDANGDHNDAGGKGPLIKLKDAPNDEDPGHDLKNATSGP